MNLIAMMLYRQERKRYNRSESRRYTILTIQYLDALLSRCRV